MTQAQRTTADRMITSKGQAVTLTRRAAGAYDPATGAAVITETTQTGRGVILPLAGYRKAQSNVVAGDETLLLSGLSTTGTLTALRVDDTLTDANAKKYTIVAIDTLAPAGLAIMFDAVLRGHQ